MLLMFVYAAVYTAPRRSPLWLVLILFLLTQTHVIATLLVPFYLFIWFCDWWSARESGLALEDPLRWIILAVFVSSAGILAAFATVYPTANDLVLQPFPDRMQILRAIGSAILQPGHFYTQPYLGGGWSPGGLRRMAETGWTVLLYFVVAGLAGRLPLLLSALGGLWGTVVFFQLVYPGLYRHQAIWILFVIALYCVEFARPARSLPVRPSPRSRLLIYLFYGAFALLLVTHFGIPKVYEGSVYESSKSRAFANLVQMSPNLHDAIILAEPDHIAEAIPYYLDNDIYLRRKGKFGKFATWSSRTSTLSLTLHDILVTARGLENKTGRPILILLEYPVTAIEPQEVREFARVFGRWRFRYDGDQARAFLAATRKLPLGPKALLRGNFDAYLLQ
jgi:hypothetical protein